MEKGGLWGLKTDKSKLLSIFYKNETVFNFTICPASYWTKIKYKDVISIWPPINKKDGVGERERESKDFPTILAGRPGIHQFDWTKYKNISIMLCL